MYTCGLHKPRGDGLDPVIDSTGIDDYTALGQPFSNLYITETVVEIPAHREGKDVIGEAVASERQTRPFRHPSAACRTTIQLPFYAPFLVAVCNTRRLANDCVGVGTGARTANE
jgi:hypothetical protein